MCGTGNISVTDFQNNHTVTHDMAPFRKVKLTLVITWVVRALLLMINQRNKLPEAQKNANDQVTVGSSLASYWLRGCMTRVLQTIQEQWESRTRVTYS